DAPPRRLVDLTVDRGSVAEVCRQVDDAAGDLGRHGRQPVAPGSHGVAAPEPGIVEMQGGMGRGPEQVVAVQPEPVDAGPEVRQALEGEPPLTERDDLADSPFAAAHAATVIARSGRSRKGGRYAGRFENGSTSSCSSIPSRSAMNARRASIRSQASG